MIKKICFSELQKAIYEDITAFGYRIYDDTPKEPVYPYCVFGASTSGDNGAKDRHGEEVTQIVHVYSVYDGYLEVQTMMNEIVEILSDNVLTMTGFKIITRQQEMIELVDISTLPDLRVLRHGVVKYRFRIEQL